MMRNDSISSIFENRYTSNNFDTYMLDGDFYIDVILPGLKKDNIDIDYYDKKIVITSNRECDENKKYQMKNTYFGEINEKFMLSFEPESIEANYENGILSLKLKRNEKEKPKIKFL